MTNAAKHITNQLMDPVTRERFTQHRYGMSSQALEQQLEALAMVQKGHMPTGRVFENIAKQAKQAYGWDAQRTKQQLQSIIDLPLPEARVAGFLHAGGRTPTSDTIREASTLASRYDSAQSEVALGDRLEQRQKEIDNDPFRPRMPNSDRFKKAAAEEGSLRRNLEFFSGSNKPETFEQKRDAVMRARLQVADRYERHATNPNPSLRDTIAAEMEIHQVNELSKEYGLGDPLAAASEQFDARNGHMSESFDPIESTGITNEN